MYINQKCWYINGKIGVFSACVRLLLSQYEDNVLKKYFKLFVTTKLQFYLQSYGTYEFLFSQTKHPTKLMQCIGISQ